MARPTNESKLVPLHGRLQASKKWRAEADREPLWLRMTKLYRGKQVKGDQASEHRVVVNVAKSTIDVIHPAVSVSNPRFSVKGRKPDAGAQAIIAQETLNYIWRTYKYHQQFRLAVRDSLIVGHGWVKVGYKKAKPPEAKKVEDGKSGDRDQEEGIVDHDEDASTTTDLHVSWEDDRPFVERVSPWDVFVPHEARHPSQMGWIAHRITRRVNDVKADPRYSPKVRATA